MCLCARVQADEVWCFTHTKEAHLQKNDAPTEWGHTYVWVALDADSKLVLSYHIGKRGQADAFKFIEDLDRRVKHRFQLTTDGHLAYLQPVETVLGMRVDYAMLVKVFATPANSGPDWYGTGQIRDLIPEKRHHRDTRPEAHQHQLRRAIEFDFAYAIAPFHPFDQCVLEKAG